MDKSLIYLIFFILVVIVTVFLIPKRLYLHYLLYGFILGGIGDTVVVYLLSKVFNLITFKHMGVYNFFGLFSIWTPLTWTAAFMLFLRFLPQKKTLLYPYLISAAIFNYLVGFTLQYLGLFEYVGIYKYFAPITFFLWYYISAWVYLKREQIALI